MLIVFAEYGEYKAPPNTIPLLVGRLLHTWGDNGDKAGIACAYFDNLVVL